MSFNFGFGLGLGAQRAGGGSTVVDPRSYAVALPITGAEAYAGALGLKRASGTPYTLQRDGGTCVMFLVRGTGCSIANFGGSNSDPNGPLRIFVDSNTEVNPDRSGGRVQLFSGLTDDWHTVSVLTATGYGDANLISDVADGITADGADPVVLLASTVYSAGTAGLSYSMHTQDSGITGFVPTIYGTPAGGFGGTSYSIGFRSAASGFFVQTSGPEIHVSIDGAAPTIYTKEIEAGVFVEPGLTGQHDYVVWSGRPRDGGFFSQNRTQISVGLFGSEDITSKVFPQLHAFGDSITEGHAVSSSSTAARVNYNTTAARNGYVPSCFGTGGATVGSLKTLINSNLSGFNVSSDDVALVAIGRNDGTETMTAQEIADYGAILDDLVGLGYGRILCLAVMPLDTDPTDYNASMEAIVAGRVETNIHYVTREQYTAANIDAVDGTHPSWLGYEQMTALDAIWLDQALPVPGATTYVSDVTVSDVTVSGMSIAVTYENATTGDPYEFNVLDGSNNVVASGSGVLPFTSITLAEDLASGSYAVTVSINGSNAKRSDSFVVSTAGAGPVFAAVSDYQQFSSTELTIDLSSVSTGDWLIIAANSAADTSSPEVALGGATIGDGTTQTAATLGLVGGAEARTTGFFKVQCPAEAAGNATARIQITREGPRGASRRSAAVYTCPSEPTFVNSTFDGEGSPDIDATLNIVTAVDDFLLVCGNGEATDDPTPTGFVIDGSIDGLASRNHWYGSASGLTTETRTVTATSTTNIAGQSVTVRFS